VEVGDERHGVAGRISFATAWTLYTPARPGCSTRRGNLKRSPPLLLRREIGPPLTTPRPVALALASAETPYNAASAEETNNGTSSNSTAAVLNLPHQPSDNCAFSYSLLSDELVSLLQWSRLFSNSCTIHSS
jgi:hypothetical protein